MPSVYEHPLLWDALGDELRPGGLALTDEALAACALPTGALVADMGCGPGVTVSHLRNQHRLAAVGIDASAVLLTRARSREPFLPLAQGFGERLPFGNGALDAVLAECTLSTLADIGATLAEFRRVLKPGGRLILTDVYVRSAERPMSPFEHTPHCGLLSQEQMTHMLAEHGFDVVMWRDRSAALKVFVARLILAGIPIAKIWGGCGDANDAGAGAKPGYYWLVASRI